MIISHKYKFIFIKTRKTAGTSVEVYLESFCGKNDIITPIYPPFGNHKARNYKGFLNPIPEILLYGNLNLKKFLERNKFYNHIPAELVRRRIAKKTWSSYYKFTIERNPWDKVISQFYMLKDRGVVRDIDDYFSKGINCFNYPQYTDKTNRDIIVNKIIMYENLSDELGKILSVLNIPYDGKLNVYEKRNHRKDRKPYNEILTSEQIKYIKKMYEWEIKQFNYTSLQ